MNTNILIVFAHSEIVLAMYLFLSPPCHFLLKFISFDHLAKPLPAAHKLT